MTLLLEDLGTRLREENSSVSLHHLYRTSNFSSVSTLTDDPSSCKELKYLKVKENLYLYDNE